MGKLYREEGSKAMKPIIVVATVEEEKIARKRFKGHRIIKTGVGGINVIRALKDVPKWHKILNFGYAGSDHLPIGTEVKVGYCSHYHDTEYDEIAYWKLGDPEDQIWCYTSDEFVEDYDGGHAGFAGVIFDMELAYIIALGFKRIESIKIISDNLSLKQYEEQI